MRKNNINLRVLFIMLLSIVMINTQAQTGLNFQGVARTSNNVILASQAITIKLSILQGSATGTADYVETRKVTTNAQGLFTAVIGDTGAISTLGNFTTINWKLSPKFLKIEMDAAAGTNFITMGTTQFQYVAYAQFAKSVDAENIVGIVPVTLGGTGVSTIAGLKTALTLNNVNNTTDLTKPISTLTQTALDLKLNAADTSKYTKQTYTDSALVAKQVLIGLKLNAADTSKYTKQTYADSALLTRLKISDTTAMLSSRIARDTLSLSNRIDLKANTTDVTTGLALKENISNKSTAVDLGGTTPSDILFPTQKAVKDYVVANNAGGGVADGGITTIKLADAAVTDAKINTVSGSKVIGSITGNAATATLATNATTATTAGNITATSNTTITSLSNLATVGTLVAGAVPYSLLTGTVPTFNQNTTGNAATATTATTAGTATTTTGNAGTATKLATARTINGIAFDGSANIDITASADAGTLTGTTLNATVTGSSLTSVGTLVDLTVTNPISGSITGNAATATLATNATTATTAGNITATANTTLTSLSSLATVGTITSGVWSGTAVAVEKGGTGATTASAARTNLGLEIGTNVQAPLVAGTNYLSPTGSAASLTNFPTFNQNTSGNAATATTAGNITATANTTLTSLSSLATVGTITSGVWSGTAVAVAKGGTGLTAAGTNGQILTSTSAGTLTWTTPSTTSTPDVFLPTVVIGTQQWMEKNLDVLTYRNGDVIPQVTDANAWAGLTTGAWCWYSNSADNGAIYGKLYNWYAVNDPRGLAPQGWHIPSNGEWTTLRTLLGGELVAGGKAKTTGVTKWASPNSDASNESGFAGLPGGIRADDGSFLYVGTWGIWWNATADGCPTLYSYNKTMDIVNSDKKHGQSVRCIRD